MSLQELIAAVQELSAPERLELIHAVSKSLRDDPNLSAADSGFWNPRSIEQILAANPVPIVDDVRKLRGTFWPPDESVDEFNDFIHRQRQEDTLRDT